MKYHYFLLLFLMLASICSAQQNYRDVVYLKNGSIIKGIIIEQIPNESLKIETSDGSIFVYEMEQIIKIIKERVNETVETNSQTEIKYDTHGFHSLIQSDFDIGVGGKSKKNYIAGTNYILDYQLASKFICGLGLGFHYQFSEGDEGFSHISLFTDFRFPLWEGEGITPLLFFEPGYNQILKRDFNAGFHLNLGVGIRIFKSNSKFIDLSISYKYISGSTGEYWTHWNQNFMTINFGYKI